MRKTSVKIVAYMLVALVMLCCSETEEDLREDIRKKKLESIVYVADNVNVSLYACKGPAYKKGSSFYVRSKTQLDSVLRIYLRPDYSSGEIKIEMPYDEKFFRNSCLLMCFDGFPGFDASACKVNHAFESDGTVYAMTDIGTSLAQDCSAADVAYCLGVVELPKKGLPSKTLKLIDDRSEILDYEGVEEVFRSDSELKTELAELLNIDGDVFAEKTVAEYFEKYRLYCTESVLAIDEAELLVKNMSIDSAGTLKLSVQNMNDGFKVANRYKFLEFDKDVEVKSIRFELQW